MQGRIKASQDDTSKELELIKIMCANTRTGSSCSFFFEEDEGFSSPTTDQGVSLLEELKKSVCEVLETESFKKSDIEEKKAQPTKAVTKLKRKTVKEKRFEPIKVEKISSYMHILKTEFLTQVYGTQAYLDRARYLYNQSNEQQRFALVGIMANDYYLRGNTYFSPVVHFKLFTILSHAHIQKQKACASWDTSVLPVMTQTVYEWLFKTKSQYTDKTLKEKMFL